MAYVQPIQQKQLEDLVQTGSGSVTTQTGNNAGTQLPATNGNASALTQATATPGSAPSQFVNFQDLIDANQIATEDYAKNVANLIGYGDTQDTLNNSTSAANSQVNAGYADVGQDTINRALSAPTETGYEGYDTLKSILGGRGYVGPKNANNVYTDAKSAVDTLGDKSGALTDPTALQQFILQKPNAGTTQGGAALDAALLTGTKGSQQQIADVQKQVGDLQKQYTTNVADTQSQIDAKAAQAAARKNEILGQANSSLNSIRSAGQAQADAQNAAEAARVEAAKTAASSGDFATLSSLIPGLDASSLSSILSQLSSKPTDLGQYLTATGPSYTAGNYVSEADRARYGGIQSLFGIQAPQIELAGNGASTQFNTGGALGALNSRLGAQRQAEAAAAAEVARQQQVQAEQIRQQQQYANAYGYMSGGGGGGGGSGGVGEGGAPTSDSVSQGQAGLSGGITPGVSQGLSAVANAVVGPTPIGLAMAAINAIGTAVGNANAPGSVGSAADGGSNSADGTSPGDASGSGTSAAGGVGGSGVGDTAGIGSTAGSGNNGGDDGAGDGGGGGGGGGKIICTAMNDLYGLPYRENKIWLMYAKRHLTPAHEIGYHKVFLPLVEYGFKQGDGLGHRVVRAALIWIGKHRTSDIKNELAGKPRNMLHKYLRAVIEPTLAAIGRWSKK
jgi:hypothetical protein